MLDAFKKRGAGDGGKLAKEQVAELQELIGQAREERGALSTMLTQVEVHGSKLSTLGRSMQDVSDRAGGATGKMAALAKRLSALEARATGLEELGNRIETLRGGVSKVEETAQQLLAPDGDLQKHRHEVQQLSAQGTQNVALLGAMKQRAEDAGRVSRTAPRRAERGGGFGWQGYVAENRVRSPPWSDREVDQAPRAAQKLTA